MAAKTFLPLIADKEGSSYTFITGQCSQHNEARNAIVHLTQFTPKLCLPTAGGPANYYVQDAGFITMFCSALVKMVMVVQAEYKMKPVRINEVCCIRVNVQGFNVQG